MGHVSGQKWVESVQVAGVACMGGITFRVVNKRA